jgi:hypothetical protein
MEHAACMEDTRNANKMLVLELKGRGQFEDLSTDVRIILKQILKKQSVRMRT